MFYPIVKWLLWFLAHIFFRISIKGKENIPSNGACMLCCNHISNLDPPLLGVCLPRRIRFMAKEELFKNKLLGFIITALGAFPIKRDGNGDLGAIKEAFKILRNNECLALFPEGKRSKTGKLGKGKTGAAMIALKSKAPLIPIAITGSYKFFGKLTVNIGAPIDLTSFYDEKHQNESLQNITDNHIMKSISELIEI